MNWRKNELPASLYHVAARVNGVTEDDFQQTVIDLAHLLGWTVSHFRKAMKADGSYITPVQADGKGFPDLFLAQPGHLVILAEIKSEKGKLSPEQTAWGELLKECFGARYFVWRPSDWDKIHAILTGKD